MSKGLALQYAHYHTSSICHRLHMKGLGWQPLHYL
uniref:Uncharacterized protein n=1 Tax=Rhizophora mucronata TaxID=61149 RepID=A0A2P2NNY4_RHIMU